MAKQQASTPGAPAASRRSPIAPTSSTSTPTDMHMDDVSTADVYKAGIRAKQSSIGTGADSALGQKGTRGRTATNASAQFRITAKHTPYTEPEAPGTMASARLMPAVMGSTRQFSNFQQDMRFEQSR